MLNNSKRFVKLKFKSEGTFAQKQQFGVFFFRKIGYTIYKSSYNNNTVDAVTPTI